MLSSVLEGATADSTCISVRAEVHPQTAPARAWRRCCVPSLAYGKGKITALGSRFLSFLWENKHQVPDSRCSALVCGCWVYLQCLLKLHLPGRPMGFFITPELLRSAGPPPEHPGDEVVVADEHRPRGVRRAWVLVHALQFSYDVTLRRLLNSSSFSSVRW